MLLESFSMDLMIQSLSSPPQVLRTVPWIPTQNGQFADIASIYSVHSRAVLEEWAQYLPITVASFPQKLSSWSVAPLVSAPGRSSWHSRLDLREVVTTRDILKIVDVWFRALFGVTDVDLSNLNCVRQYQKRTSSRKMTSMSCWWLWLNWPKHAPLPLGRKWVEWRWFSPRKLILLPPPPHSVIPTSCWGEVCDQWSSDPCGYPWVVNCVNTFCKLGSLCNIACVNS